MMVLMTKTQIAKKRNRMLNIAVIVIDTIVFVRVIFNFAMSINGSWDDINTPSLMVLTVSAVVALLLALMNNIHYKGHPSYVLASVIVLGLAAIFFMYVMVSLSFAQVLGG